MVKMIHLLNVVAVKLIAAFRAELGRILGILGLPAALVAAVKGFVCRLLRTAFRAELTLVHCAAAADPTLGCAALGAELAGIDRAALAGPAVLGSGRGGRLLGLLGTHLEKLGYRGILLVPGEAYLTRVYEGMGYRPCTTIREFCCTGAAEEIQIYRIDKEAYGKLRRTMLPAGGVIQEEEKAALAAAAKEKEAKEV